MYMRHVKFSAQRLANSKHSEKQKTLKIEKTERPFPKVVCVCVSRGECDFGDTVRETDPGWGRKLTF